MEIYNTLIFCFDYDKAKFDDKRNNKATLLECDNFV